VRDETLKIVTKVEKSAKRDPAPEFVRGLTDVLPGRALDLACGSGRHAIWLAEQGWDVTAVDIEPSAGIPGFIQADLESHEFTVEFEAWDLIVCWLYWQPDLLPEIARGVRSGGIVALAGKTTGRFATSLAQFREGFRGWQELASGQDEMRAYLIARRLSF
jgi:SAM-dependent methyltransferase